MRREPVLLELPSLGTCAEFIHRAQRCGTMILISQYYLSCSSARQRELDFCLKTNLSCPLFDKIILFGAPAVAHPRLIPMPDGRPTFHEFLHTANEHPNQLIVVSNSDITFDETLWLAETIAREEVFALTRWQSDGAFYKYSCSQDVWIFRTPVILVDAHFPLGIPGCDGRIAYLFHEAGYSVRNPSLSIKVWHHHMSAIRSYSTVDRLRGIYLRLPPTSLELRATVQPKVDYDYAYPNRIGTLGS